MIDQTYIKKKVNTKEKYIKKKLKLNNNEKNL